MNNEQEWKRNLYKAKNFPSLTSETIADPPEGDPPKKANENEWKRDLHQKRLAAQNTNLKDPPEEGATNPAAAAEQALTSKIRTTTAEALRQSWINILDSFGLTFLYIIFHYTFAYLGGPFARFFPRAGREWLMRNLQSVPLPQKLKDQAIETQGAIVEPFELMLFFLVLGLIALIILIIVLILYALSHPCEAVKALGELLPFNWLAKMIVCLIYD
jgi:hypothetical protein